MSAIRNLEINCYHRLRGISKEKRKSLRAPLNQEDK